MEDLKRKNNHSKVEKKCKAQHVPKFLIKPGTKTRSFYDISNLVLWIFSEKEGKMPSWMFVQNKHLAEKLIIIQLDGLDLDTLKEINNESGTFLSTLITPNLSTAVFNRNNEKFSLGSCENQSKNPETTKKTLEDYLMTQEELIINNFDFSPDFLEAEDREIEDRLSLVSIDCEMVLCGEQKKLARVTLIDKNFEILMDELIKIPETITDYLTKYSGITEAMISEARLDFEETQRKVLTFISKKTILCGHSLENDLFFLKIKHFRVIDTSVIFPHPTQGYKLSLKHLTFNYLNKTIQKVFENQGTHDSAEDASAALELVYLKVQNGPSFGVKSRSNYPDVTEILKNEGKNIKTLKNFQEFQQSEKVSIFYIQLEEIEKNFNFSDRKGEISSIVAGWEEKIKEILRNLDDQTGMILLSSLGDVKYSEHLTDQRNLKFNTWSTEEELNWNKVQKSLTRTFSSFFFKSQLPNPNLTL